MKPLKICFISLNSYPLFSKKSRGYFGGAELQISLVAKELARDKRFQVSLIVGNHGQKRVLTKQGIKIYKTRIIDFFNILRSVNADIYVERTANIKVGLVGWFCKVFNKKFIYMMAHDRDMNNKWLYWFGLKNADLIIAQTKTQQKNLKKNFDLNSQLITSVIKPWKLKKTFKREFILWVGRADDWKRPITFLRLAQEFPKEKFIMICRQGKDKELFKRVKKMAELQSNLSFFPAVPIKAIVEFFAKAKFLVNTSTTEGFPNTFLQAGMAKIPVLSLKVNPDNYIYKYSCGLTADNSQKKMAKLCRQMLNNPKLLKTRGENHFNYVKKNHGFKNINIFKGALIELFRVNKLKLNGKYLIKATVLAMGWALILYWLFFLSVAGVKQIPGELKTRANLPDNDKIISLVVEKGQTKEELKVDNYDQEKLAYYSIANLGRRTIKPKVVINGQDWLTDRSIVDYALKGIDKQKANNEEKVIALLKFVAENRYHWPAPLYKASYHFIENPVQYFNSWGYGFCDDSALVLAQLLYLAGFEARQVGIEKHVITEVFYDGAWHALDPDMVAYYRNLKGEIASIEEIVDNNQLLDSPTWLQEVSEPTKKLIREIQAVSFSKKTQNNNPAEVSVKSKDYQDELIYSLRPNEEIRFYYDFKGKYYWGFTDEEPPKFTNGVLISENKGGFYQFRLPFPILASYIYQPNLCKAINKVKFSRDGIRWKKITDCQDNVLSLADLFPVGKGSYPTQQYFLVLPLSLKNYQILTQFQTAPRSIPRPNAGINDIEIKKSLKSDIEIEFGYLYNEPGFEESNLKDD